MRRSIAVVRGALLASLVSLACQRPAAGELRDGCPGCAWQRLGLAAGFRPQSLALLDGALYVGTQDAELYRLVGWP